MERRCGQRGPAQRFLAENRAGKIRMSIITTGEIAVLFHNVLLHGTGFRIGRVTGCIPELWTGRRLLTGRRLGENDNWIAGFARYYREPVISNDKAFDSAPGVRRLDY